MPQCYFQIVCPSVPFPPFCPAISNVDDSIKFIIVGAGRNSKRKDAEKGHRMNIYVGNIPYSMTENEVKALFEQYGEVSNARVITDRETGRAKGFAFVEMPNKEQAIAAIEAVNGSEQGGRSLIVNEARPREDRPRRQGGFPRRNNRFDDAKK